MKMTCILFCLWMHIVMRNCAVFVLLVICTNMQKCLFMKKVLVWKIQLCCRWEIAWFEETIPQQSNFVDLKWRISQSTSNYLKSNNLIENYVVLQTILIKNLGASKVLDYIQWKAGMHKLQAVIESISILFVEKENFLKNKSAELGGKMNFLENCGKNRKITSEDITNLAMQELFTFGRVGCHSSEKG